MNELTELRPRYDAVVVGARCAGAATALLLARGGLRVLALDRGAYGTDTLSTHALMRAGVLQLARWGVLGRVVEAGTPAIRRTTFHYEGSETLAVAIKPRDGVDALYAPRRTVIDRILVDAAREAGAEVQHRTRVDALLRSADGRVGGVVVAGEDGSRREVRAQIVIGADGARSSVAALAGAETRHRARSTASTLYGYWPGLELDGNHWHYAPGVAVGAIPTNGGETCVFVAMPPARFAAEMRRGPAAAHAVLLAAASAPLAEAVRATGARPAIRGFAGLPGFVRRPFGPGWALVGDAGYFKDPITAHGMSDALRDAELVARAVLGGTDEALAGYEEERDALSLPLFRITEAVASFDWDIETVKALHLELSREMNREVESLRGLDGPKKAA